MSKTIALSLSLMMLAPVAAFAGHGDDHKQCDHPVQDCLNHMVSKLKSAGFIGVELDDSKVAKQLIVTKVVPGSPAEKAGIQEGDQLFALDGIEFGEKNEEALKKVKVPGKEVVCTIKRKGTAIDLKLTLVPMPADTMAKYIGEHMMSHAKLPEGATAKK